MGILRVQNVARHPSDAAKIRVTWSEPAVAADAGTAGNYALAGPGGLTISAATVVAGSGNLQVDLTASGALISGSAYTVTVSNVRDIATNTAIVPNNHEAVLLTGMADNGLNGVPHAGGLRAPVPPLRIGDKPMGYNVIASDCPVMSITSIQVFPTYLLVTFDDMIVLGGAALLVANYKITGPFNVQITSFSVESPGTVMKFNVTTMQGGGAYTLDLPQGITGENGNVYFGPFSKAFTGVANPATVQIAKSVDEKTLDIIFNKAVWRADAENPANYSISPTIAVTRAERITDFHYRLTTGSQAINQAYTVTASNIRDINGIL